VRSFLMSAAASFVGGAMACAERETGFLLEIASSPGKTGVLELLGKECTSAEELCDRVSNRAQVSPTSDSRTELEMMGRTEA
jgi:hypothetical protein